MSTASLVLLIIVSSIMTLFLIVLIVAIVYVIKVLKQLKRITERADNVSASVEAATRTFERAASPLAIVKLLGGIVEQTAKLRKRRN